MRKSRKMMLSERLELFNIFTDSIFSRLTNNSTNFMPKRRTNRKMMTLAVVMAKSQISVPRITPKAYPAPISKGPPGITARSTCRMFIPIKPRTPHIPLSLTQTRNCLGSDTKWTRGRPIKYPIRITKTMVMIASIRLICFVFFSL